MSNFDFRLAIQFIALILVQVLILNHINFLGYINPYLYLLFILLYPIKNDRTSFIFISFLIGLFVDIFSDSGGINAAASVFIAFIRPIILKFSFGMVYEYQTLKFNTTDLGNRIIYFLIMIVIHHFILFSMDVFNFADILTILQRTIFSTIFTLILCLFTTILFSKKAR